MPTSNRSELFESDSEGVDFSQLSNAKAAAKDEEELLWAAIERLPTVKRVNVAILSDSPSARVGEGVVGGGKKVGRTVDVRKLDRHYRERIVQKALDTPEQDNYKLVSKNE